MINIGQIKNKYLLLAQISVGRCTSKSNLQLQLCISSCPFIENLLQIDSSVLLVGHEQKLAKGPGALYGVDKN